MSWFSEAWEDAGEWTENAVKTAGKAAHSAINAVDTATGAIGNAIGSVPILGAPLEATYNLAFGTPFQIVSSVANGDRIDKALVGTLKQTIKEARTVAPYAQAVISFVPGVGTGVSGAIGAGMALADGKSIDEAIVAGVKDSIPGGPVAQAAFVVAKGTIEGDEIDDIAIDAIPVTDKERELIRSGLKVSKAAINGDRVDIALLDEGLKQLDPMTQIQIVATGNLNEITDQFVGEVIANFPKETADALKIGLAVGTGIGIQKKLSAVANDLREELEVQGGALLQDSDTYKAAFALLNYDDKQGYLVGLGLMTHSDLTEAYINAVHDSLPPEQQRGFDIAVSGFIGRTLYQVVPALPNSAAMTAMLSAAPSLPSSAAFKAGYYTTMGARGNTEERKIDILTTLSESDQAYRDGIYQALKDISQAKQMTWFDKVVDFVIFWR